MSNKQNDTVKEQLYERAQEFIEKKMDANTTIPDFMRDTLVNRKFNKLWEEYNDELFCTGSGVSSAEEPEEFEAEDCTNEEEE